MIGLRDAAGGLVVIMQCLTFLCRTSYDLAKPDSTLCCRSAAFKLTQGVQAGTYAMHCVQRGRNGQERRRIWEELTMASKRPGVRDNQPHIVCIHALPM